MTTVSGEPAEVQPTDDPAGVAWVGFTTTLEGLPERLLAADFPTNDRRRAEGLRHLARAAQRRWS